MPSSRRVEDVVLDPATEQRVLDLQITDRRNRCGPSNGLRADLDQRDHLFHLAGLTPPPHGAGGHLSPGLISLASRLVDVPVCIYTDIGQLLWRNALFAALGIPSDADPSRDGNSLWLWFTRPAVRDLVPAQDRRRLSATHVSDLRAVHARRSGDQDVTTLVDELLECSAEFRTLWERHDVAVRRQDHKDVLHPEVGLIHLRCEVLLTPEADVQLVAFFPVEGTDAAEKLDLLRVIGIQDFRLSPT